MAALLSPGRLMLFFASMNLTMDQQAYFDAFLGLHPEIDYSSRRVSAWHFGSLETETNMLADLVLKGDKRATTSAFWCYDGNPDGAPKLGELSIITYYDGKPACIIETTRINKIPFKYVDAAFARTEGEGDKSLGYWRKVHKKAFSSELKRYGLSFSSRMLVLYEEFRVIHR